MATHFPSTFDALAEPSDRTAGSRVGLRLGTSARLVARGLLLSLLFFAGFAWGAIAGAESERATIEVERSLW